MARRKPPQPPLSASALFSQVVYQSFGQFSGRDAWSPAINVYQRADRLEVCVDLAGVDRQKVEVHVEPGRLTIQGVRPAPDPPDHEGQPMRIVSMEIDHGSFKRVLSIPGSVDLSRVESQYREGLLWVVLPRQRRQAGRPDQTSTEQKDG